MKLPSLRSQNTPNTTTSKQKEPALYGLNHAILNIPLLPPSMWMNMGYWKDTTDFPTACATLLDQVLITAGLLTESESESGDGNGNGAAEPIARVRDPGKKLRLLDVGIGCGDQSLRILNYKRVGITTESGEDERKGDEPLFDSYTGITSIPVQAEYASQRVQTYLQEEQGNDQEDKREPRARIFCADAANPSSWGEEIHSSITPPSSQHEPGPDSEQENWLLALDTAYHFHPSRLPLYTYTHSTLGASLMTFDLLLSPSASLLQRLVLRLLCLLSGTPWGNFLTETQYRDSLIEAGYDESKIVVRDISEYVFSGIAGFIGQRQKVAGAYGLGNGMGKFKGAGRLFGWWGRSGVVRGAVVVARI